MILMIPIITRAVGLEMFGHVMVSNAIAGLMGILINYATVQTSVKEIAFNHKDNKIISKIFNETIFIRILLFFLMTAILVSSKYFFPVTFLLYLSIVPIIFGEAINPLFFFLGQENLRSYNLSNLVTKVITIIAILIFIKGRSDGVWVNFIIGLCTSVNYLILVFVLIKKYQLKFIMPKKKDVIKIYTGNFYLVANNFSVHLQQSLMLFALQRWGTDAWLGAYSLCDKVIWSSRLLIISISSALYPKSAQLFKEGQVVWIKFRNKTKIYIGGLFFLLSAVLFLFPGFIILILSGQENETAVTFLRFMSLAPTLAALNSMNVLDRLLYNDTKSIFQIAFILLLLSLLISVTLVKSKSYFWFGAYTLSIESFALLLYELHIRRKNNLSLNPK